jgi:thioredoxin-related protein
MVLLALALRADIGLRDTTKTDPLRWHTDYDAAKATASKSGAPLLLYFRQAGCAPCLKLEREVLAAYAVATLIDERFVPVKVDLTASEPAYALGEACHVQGTPTLIVMDAAGRESGCIRGYRSAEEIGAFLRPLATPDRTRRVTGQDRWASDAADVGRKGG